MPGVWHKLPIGKLKTAILGINYFDYCYLSYLLNLYSSAGTAGTEHAAVTKTTVSGSAGVSAAACDLTSEAVDYAAGTRT